MIDNFLFCHEIGTLNTYSNPQELLFLRSTSKENSKSYMICAKNDGDVIVDKYNFTLYGNEYIVSSSVFANLKNAMDFVFRIKVNKSFIKKIIYEEKEFLHKSSNVYQYLEFKNIIEQPIILITNDLKKIELTFKSELEFNRANWKEYFYIRDEKNYWIFHFRLMPLFGYIKTKNCTTWAKTKPVSKFIQSFFDKINYTEKILYKSELSPRHPIFRRFLNFNSYIFTDLLLNGKFEFKLSKK